MRRVTLSRLHGGFNVLSGLWPLVHMKSFEAVFGPKTDKWLVRTVAGLLVSNGVAQLAAKDTAGSLAQAKRIGLGTAATLGAIDVSYAPRGRISRMYLLDALAEAAWLLAWLLARPRRSSLWR